VVSLGFFETTADAPDAPRGCGPKNGRSTHEKRKYSPSTRARAPGPRSGLAFGQGLPLRLGRALAWRPGACGLGKPVMMVRPGPRLLESR
jgi:hypothetical protein